MSTICKKAGLPGLETHYRLIAPYWQLMYLKFCHTCTAVESDWDQNLVHSVTEYHNIIYYIYFSVLKWNYLYQADKQKMQSLHWDTSVKNWPFIGQLIHKIFGWIQVW